MSEEEGDGILPGTSKEKTGFFITQVAGELQKWPDALTMRPWN